jgi:hypothetical protein
LPLTLAIMIFLLARFVGYRTGISNINTYGAK